MSGSDQRPVSSPATSKSALPLSTKSQHRYSDRFIPSREGSGDMQAAFDLLRQSRHSSDGTVSRENSSASSNSNTGADGAAGLSLPVTSAVSSGDRSSPASSSGTMESSYSMLLRAELLDTPPPPPPTIQTTTDAGTATPPAANRMSRKRPQSLHSTPPAFHPGLEALQRVDNNPGNSPLAPAGNLFRFRSVPPTTTSRTISGTGPLNSLRDESSPAAAALRLSLMNAPGRGARRVARAPFKVLDAPCLKDDFYLNLVDWSSRNVLSVGLGSCVYLWSACTSIVTKLCDLQFGGPVCSVAWNPSGTQLAVGTMPGQVQIWDAASCRLIRTMTGHTARAGCLAWNSSSLLSSGGRDREIFNRDLRSREPYVTQLSGHRQEVCGLKWSPDDAQLASGGNDNQLLIWAASGSSAYSPLRPNAHGIRTTGPLLQFAAHDAAVKAIAWSPHARGVLSSGGGTADRRIRFWNTMTNSQLASVDTGSQVCNLAWSKTANELVSTHGYSQNQIVVWKYPSLTKVVTLMGHSYRVLYLALSPSGETIVTGAGDETLRFWNVFPPARNDGHNGDSASVLSPSRMSIR